MRAPFILIMLFLPFVLLGQIDIKGITNIVKQEAPDIVKEQIIKQLKKSRENYSSVDYNYAVSFGDNSSLYENKETFKSLQKVSLYFLDKQSFENIPPLQKSQDLNSLAETMYASGKYKSAEFSFNQSLYILNTNGYENSAEASLVISNLGLLYHNTGRFALAEEYTLKALEMRSNNPEQIGISASYNNLGVLYKDMGFYSESEVYLEKALSTAKQLKTDNIVNQAIILNNKAMLYQVMGRYKEAELLLIESIALADKELREKSSSFVKLKVNLALLYQLTNRYTEAEKIYKEAIEIKKKRLGTKHPDYAILLRNLASLYMIMKKYPDSEALLNQAIELTEKKLGTDNPVYAAAVYDKAVLYQLTGKVTEALTLLQKVSAIQNTTLGAHHPAFTNTKEQIALAYWQLNDFDKAIAKYRSVLDEYIYQINSYFPAMNDNEKNKFWERIQPKFNRFYSFAYDAYSTNNQITADLYNYHIATKALLLSSSRKVKDRILSSNNLALKEKYQQWLDTKSYIGRLYTYTDEELKEEQINLDSLERAAGSLEKELSLLSEDFKQSVENKTINYTDIASKLSSTEAAVEIIRISNYNFLLPDTAVYYAALVVTNTQAAPQIQWFTNGNLMEFDYVKAYSKSIHNGKDMSRFYNWYWAGLEDLTKNYPDLYVSVDGIYNQVNLNTLQKTDEKYLLDEKNIRYVTNTKDIIELKLKQNTKMALKQRTGVLFGFPDYLLNLSAEYAYLSPLPGTKIEVENIVKILKTGAWNIQSYFAADATEDKVKQVKSPFLLHIATHGFFLTDIVSSMPSVFGIEPLKAAENPLLRSGLMFAGADKTVQQIDTKSTKGTDDGILNAFEAMILNLENTEMVVLSACETGLGEIKSGEGVYGLQRAFQIAGASTVLLSLWEVSDEGTQNLMIAFYKNWLQSGNKYDAFRKAQLEMKTKYKFPYFWGAFIMVNQ